ALIEGLRAMLAEVSRGAGGATR
ncbi:TetR family transcriptional regulator, partial [Streptomyces sp. SM8]